MPAYAFAAMDAMDAQGASRRGILEADTAKSARGQRKSRSLVPLDVRPVAAGNSGPGRR